jgi:hypothetical protein
MFDKLSKNNIILFVDTLYISILVAMLWIFKSQADIVLVSFFILAIIVLRITERLFLFKDLSIAFAISFIWNIIAKKQYNYGFHFIKIAGINIMPLFAWGLGLFGLYIIYTHFQEWFKFKKLYKKFLLFTIIYWSLLIIIEYIAYHFMGLKDMATKGYKGLPFLDCIHAPSWMQTAYFSMGLIYYISLTYLKRYNIQK